VDQSRAFWFEYKWRPVYFLRGISTTRRVHDTHLECQWFVRGSWMRQCQSGFWGWIISIESKHKLTVGRNEERWICRRRCHGHFYNELLRPVRLFWVWRMLREFGMLKNYIIASDRHCMLYHIYNTALISLLLLLLTLYYNATHKARFG
jgi:hypothetical protein